MTEPLVVKRTIRASADRLFAAWTDPEELRQWWGPEGVTCSAAEVDLREGGQYRIGNLLPDGSTLWISGEFERIDPPRELIYSWRVDPGGADSERVTVRFEPRGESTEVTVVHERIPTLEVRERHEHGWLGCLDGLERFASA